VTLISSEEKILRWESEALRNAILKKIEEKNIKVVTGGKVSKITEEGVHLVDGRFFDCNVPIWATGAEA